MVTKTEKANVVTSILGYDENQNYRHSAIPIYMDEWFHGDFDTVREQSLTDARGTKTLEEYDSSANPFPAFRINSAIEISFDTSDGQTISNATAEMTDPDDPNSPGGLSPVTLEGASDEEANPFRNEYDYDGSDNQLDATVKGPHDDEDPVGPIDGIEGYRGSLILGGSDPYVDEAKSRGELYEILETETDPIRAAFIARGLATPSFYSFLDFTFMADGTKLVRVWDASVYPAHALYVGEDKKDQNPFREGQEWTKDGPLRRQSAFVQFVDDAHVPGYTPFDGYGSWRYKENFDEILAYGEHPAMTWEADGTEITADEVRNALSDPLFPSTL
jgi:hypothetical protein